MKLALPVDWTALFDHDEKTVSFLLKRLTFVKPDGKRVEYDNLNDGDAGLAGSVLLADVTRFLEEELAKKEVTSGMAICADYLISRISLYQAYYARIAETIDQLKVEVMGDSEVSDTVSKILAHKPGESDKIESTIDTLITTLAGDHLARLEAEMSFILMSVARLPKLANSLTGGGPDLGPLMAKLQTAPLASSTPFKPHPV